MIVIDDLADTKLVKALEALRIKPDNSRCLHFNLKDRPAIDGIGDKIFHAAQFHIPSNDTQIYLCGDKDIFILAPNMPVKDAKLLMLEVADFAKLPVTDDFVTLHETDLHLNKLLYIVSQKIELRRKAQEEAAKKREQEMAERKRLAILNNDVAAKAGDIRARRASRNTTELMIIEDDAFTRRLVENVLQKKYGLTALPNAEHALSTYSRTSPNLLFLDINLPDVTGHELLEKIIAIDPDAYVIMLSGNADKENITQAMSKGAKGFIAKPFTRDKLFQYIERCPTIASS